MSNEPTAPMQRVWKVASRWSEDGNEESSILDIFRAHQVIFVGKKRSQFDQIQEGDLVMISDGRKVVALGIATSAPADLPSFRIPFTKAEESQFDYDNWVKGCRVSFTDLRKEDWIICPPGTFHQVHERADEARRLYARLHKRFEEQQEFDIQAKSCTLLQNLRQPDHILWQSGLAFRVPVYQRAYSWKEPEVRRFVTDLLAAFHGSNGRPVQEPMFIGTMQLTEKRLIDQHGQMVHEVIDGQQRLSTLILLLKVLRDRAADLPVWPELALESRLRTAVSSGAQQTYLDEVLAASSMESDSESQNPYLEVVPVITGLLNQGAFDSEDLAEDDRKAPAPLDVAGFVLYLTSRVYFVVIETRASLSKTLQIFDAINTSGMDLNGGDVFKVRYYEYLQVTKKVGECEFENISKMYHAVDEGNRAAGCHVCSIEDVLSLERHLLVARHGMPKVLHDFGASVFFDRFFDTVLRVNKWPNFVLGSCHAIKIEHNELARLINARFEWHRQVPSLSLEARCMWDFIWASRYHKYHYLMVLFRDRFGSDRDITESFIVNLAKLLVLYSILYWRTVHKVRQLMHDLLDMMVGESASATAQESIQFIRQKTVDQKAAIKEALEKYEIAHNPTAKALACKLSAFLHEKETWKGSAEELRALIFDTEIDIEHIESVNHMDLNEREKIQKVWGIELNGIGNLIMLERTLNRHISNGHYVFDKLPVYRDRSGFNVVKAHATSYPQWTLDLCQKRKAAEVSKLVAYLCD